MRCTPWEKRFGGTHHPIQPTEDTVFEYRLQEIRRADLIKAAEAHQLARDARRARRTERRATTEGKGPVTGPEERFVRVA